MTFEEKLQDWKTWTDADIAGSVTEAKKRFFLDQKGCDTLTWLYEQLREFHNLDLEKQAKVKSLFLRCPGFNMTKKFN